MVESFSVEKIAHAGMTTSDIMGSVISGQERTCKYRRIEMTAIVYIALPCLQFLEAENIVHSYESLFCKIMNVLRFLPYMIEPCFAKYDMIEQKKSVFSKKNENLS